MLWMHSAWLRGTRFRFEVRGQGHPVVLIHAGIADLRMWDEPFRAVSLVYRAMRYDVRGFGRTPSPAGRYSDAADLLALADHLEFSRVAAVGACSGGGIALDFALEHPGRVSALVLVGTAIGGHPGEVGEDAAEVGEDAEEVGEDAEEVGEDRAGIDALCEEGDTRRAVEARLRMWVDGPGRRPEQVDVRVRERVRRMLLDRAELGRDAGEWEPLEPAAAGRLAEITAPTLIIVGSLDHPHQLDLSRLLAESIPGAREVVVEGAGHLPSMERSREFNAVVLEFLKATL